MTRTRTVLAVAALAAATAVLPACGSPCADLGTPTAAEQSLANSGAEIERDGSWGEECELSPSGSWRVDD